MRKVLFITSLLFAIAFGTIQAQHISVNININSQPAWGPVGYDYARYYYFPDIDCYYDIEASLFYYMNGRHWVSARYLPMNYHRYDLYRIYKVVLNDYQPWRYYNNHRRTYARYRGNHSQVVIHKSNDRRYHQSRSNRRDWVSPEHRSNRKQNDYNNRNNQDNNRRYSDKNQSRQNSRNNKDYKKESNRQYNNRNNQVKPNSSNERNKNTPPRQQNNRVQSSKESRSNYNSSLRLTNNSSRSNKATTNSRGSGRS